MREDTRFLADLGMGDRVRRHERIMLPALPRDPVRYETAEALRLIGLGAIMGGWFMWAIVGVVWR